MFRLIVAKIIILSAILTFGGTAYYGCLLPFGLIGSALLVFLAQALESQVYDLRGPTLRGTIGGILLFFITFRLSLTLEELGYNLNEMILNDQVNILAIGIGILIYLFVDISLKSRRIRCSGIKTKLKGLGTAKRLTQKWEI